MYRLLTIPIVLVLLLGGAIWWSTGGGESRADFSFVNRGEVGTLDPNRMSWLQDIRVGYALWEGLYTLDPQTMAVIHGAADRVEVSRDKKVYTFYLRTDGKWSDGSVVTAGDFLFAWRRMLREPADYTYLFYCISGAQEYVRAYQRDAATADFGRVGIEAVDSSTFRVTLKHPVAYFPDLCAFTPFFPLNEASMRPFERRMGGRVSYRAGFTRPPYLVTNGPFKLESWQFKRKIRLTANAYYWDHRNVRSRTIDVVSAEDAMASYQTYQSGAVDWLAEVTGEIAAELRAQRRDDLHIFPSFGTYFYSINCQPRLTDGSANPFADVRVRRAFAMAIDKRPIVEVVTRMGEQTADTFVPRGIFANYGSPQGLGYDVAAAQKLLAEAGYPGGKGFATVTILFNSEMHHGDVAQVIQRQWQQNLGVKVELQGLEIKDFRSRLHNGEYMIARASWIGDYNDPSTFMDKYLSASENNDARWVNEQYDWLCAQAAVETDPVQRMKLFERAEAILLDEAPIIPLYYYVNAYMFRSDVHGLAMDPRNMVMFNQVWVDRK